MGKGHSLHIGLNSVDPDHYDGWIGALRACEADAASMQKICASQGFQTEQLLTKEATRDEVLGRLENFANTLVAGDTLVISYSGHGGQLPDGNDDEDDGLDETWCLYDGDLLDDELYRAWAGFAEGVRIILFSDSCHSGTVSREPLYVLRGSAGEDLVPAAGGSRAMPLEIQYRTYEANRVFYDGLLAKEAPPQNPACTVLLISGCQDNQLSIDGAFNGAFTGALIRTWANGKFKANYAEFTKAVRKRLPATQSPQYSRIGAENADFESRSIFTL
jgi:hypothetical protein